MSNYNNVNLSYVCGNASQLPKNINKPEIVFSGKSNVGKSSLINRLLNRKSFARVSATPGKTGTINFYELQELFLVDLPGYGYAKVSLSEKKRWAKLVEGYFNSKRNIKLVVQIIDIRHKPSQDDMDMMSYLNAYSIPYIIVLTKSDKLSEPKIKLRMEELIKEIPNFNNIKSVIFSSLSRRGLDELKNLIDDSIIVEEGD